MHEQRTRIIRLSVWFLVNTIIFITCYLNYRLHLKHRYLYKTLNAGLCFSRAAAMVINFNLLLVWLPMCKYSLTRLAYLANGSLKHLKQTILYHHNHQNLASSAATTTTVCDLMAARHQQQDQYQNQEGAIIVIDNGSSFGGDINSVGSNSSKFELLLSKVKSSANRAIWQLQHWFYCAKLNSISSFLMAVDHCTSLHTICATTITIASVIHTVAHLMNVINFSNNYDPLLSNLNMAEFRGQNPFQLLVSVPGITGSLMIIILILMSLSSVGFIRNSSYDLFQIFHRLSIIFVILLFLHPSSHVLKEQSNVDRHNPELCYDKMMASISLNSTTVIFQPESNLNAASQRTRTRAPPQGNVTQLPYKILPAFATSEQNENHHLHHYHEGRPFNSSAARRNYYAEQSKPVNNNHNIHKTTRDLNNNHNNIKKGNQNVTTIIEENGKLTVPPADSGNNNTSGHYYNYSQLHYNNKTVRRDVDDTIITNNIVRTDTHDDELSPESSSNRFCLDPRPLFVAQSSICWYVLSVGLSCYLVDLILRKSRRSKNSIQLLDVRSDCEGNLIELILNSNHQRFGQWLPGQFVYLNCPQVATFEWHPFTISSMDNRIGQFTLHIKTGGDWTRKLRKKLEYIQQSQYPSLQNDHHHHQQQRHLTYRMEPGTREIFFKSNSVRLQVPVLPDFDCYSKTGELQIECTKVVCISNEIEHLQQEHPSDGSDNCLEIDLSGNNQEPNSTRHKFMNSAIIRQEKVGLELYIDGPFHSPFERLLGQQVSVCIANGVGWTAFSSVFQCLTNNFLIRSNEDRPVATAVSNIKKLSDTKLHLMVIVTSIEQLKPFYELALKYFNRIQNECQISVGDQLNPVREITAFLTRSTKDDHSVKEFCQQENLSIFYENHVIKVNDLFTINFGKPKFGFYLGELSAIYTNYKKISVYCCGSYQVKKQVREICLNLNRDSKRQAKLGDKILRPFYSYHEENF